MRNFIVNVFNFLRKPVSVSLWWLALLVFIWLSNLWDQVREGGFNWGALTVVILVMFVGDWLLGYLNNRTTDRSLPQQWDHSGYTLTLQRDGSDLVGKVGGVEMVRGSLEQVPYFRGPNAVHNLRHVLEAVAEGKRTMEDRGYAHSD